jgi:hypothetical protein
MSHIIEIRDIISNDKPYKAYYLVGNFPFDDNEIFLGVIGECQHMPDMCHVSFVKYRDTPEMVDVMILTSDIDKVFQFYADHVASKADEYAECKEWEYQMQDSADARIVLGDGNNLGD